MTTRTMLGLVASGPTQHNPLVRLPALALHLGPVLSTSPAVASRISRTLRAGWVARSWDELARADALLICAADPALAWFVEEMEGRAGLWCGRLLVACDVPWAHARLAKLALAGATVIALVTIDRNIPLYLLDGERRTTIRWRRLLRESGAKTVEAAEDGYRAAEQVWEQRLPEVLSAVESRLRQAGMASAEARRIIEVRFQRSVRSFFRAPGRACAGAAGGG